MRLELVFKRFFDFVLSGAALVVLSPFLLTLMLLIWLQDRHSPLYVASRVGKGQKPFRMVKLRSMVASADQDGVDSTGASDSRITRIGHLIRRTKMDEVMQLWNVFKGDMSLVGPRPNTMRHGVEFYTDEEKHLLDVRPGITDFASIVFSDEGDILAGSDDPDLKYNQVIRPWKSRLGLLYVRNRTLWIDIRIILLTVLALTRKRAAIRGVYSIVSRLTDDELLLGTIKREAPLQAYPPPGADAIVQSRGATDDK